MNFQNIVGRGFDREAIAELIAMGKKGPWLRPQMHENITSTFSIRGGMDSFKLFKACLKRNKDKPIDTALGLLWLECFSAIAADGPKLFRPTAEQCESMEHVRINIPLADYRQPYPAMVIEFPQEYRHLLEKRTIEAGKKLPIPRFCLLRHAQPTPDDPPYFFSGSIDPDYPNPDGEQCYLCLDRPQEFPQIESWLERHNNERNGYEPIAEALTRVSMNLAMLLSYHPHICGPSAPAIYERAKSNRCKDKAEVNRIEATTHVHVMRFSQEIIVRKRAQAKAGGGPGDGTGTHARPKPHWREGHWRHQPYGEKMLQRKLIFLNPVFINGDLFFGDRADTSVTYRW